jgi:two-component system phosphate regulon sensor histidine kinase PhoR
MSERRERHDDADTRAPSRRAAVLGAVLASAILAALAAARGFLDPWFLAGAVVAVAISAAAAGRDRRRPAAPPLRQETEPARFADALLATIPDPVILVDRRVVVLEANAAAVRLLPALRPKQPLSFALRSPGVLQGIEQVLASGRPLHVEYAERVPTERSFDVLIGPLTPQAHDKQSIVLFFRDLTAARRLEQMRADFVANASHELRTPLASLLGFIETLQGPARNDAGARERFLGIMHEQGRRMARLLEDLLSLSRIEMRTHVAPESVLDLAETVAHMIEALAPLSREQGVTVDLEVAERPLWVQGDRDELLRLTENLVENAVKYGASGERVEVALRRLPAVANDRPRVELSVRDFGPGIAPEHLPRLTERFYRVDIAESREKGGTGLGLAIVKHIVARHRGQLAIESEPGQGAVFRAALPEAPAPGEAPKR